jgi:F-type H+-transporting ATPase subunit c
VNKMIRVTMTMLALMLLASPVFADETAPGADEPVVETGAEVAASNLLKSLAAVGAGIVILGAGFGIGRIGGQAVEGMSRQPEAAGSIQTAMIISAALIEGATFFALIVCIMSL